MNFSKCFIVIALLLAINGCVKELDLEQANDIELTPTLESDLVYFDLDAQRATEEILTVFGIDNLPPIESFIPSNYPSAVELADTTRIEVFDDTFFVENLTEADVLFQFTNSTATSYIAQIVFLTEDDQIVYETSFSIGSGSEETPLVVTQTDSFNEELEDITNTVKIAVNTTIDANVDFIYNPVGSLIFKSSGTFYFLIDEE